MALGAREACAIIFIMNFIKLPKKWSGQNQTSRTGSHAYADHFMSLAPGFVVKVFRSTWHVHTMLIITRHTRYVYTVNKATYTIHTRYVYTVNKATYTIHTRYVYTVNKATIILQHPVVHETGCTTYSKSSDGK